MSQGDQFHQRGYGHYLKSTGLRAPKRSRGGGYGGHSGMFSGKTRRFLRSPVFTGVILIASIVLFIGAVFITYPAQEQDARSVPVVRADLRPVKVVPENRGGALVPNKESALLSRPDTGSVQAQQRRIENLLAREQGSLPQADVDGRLSKDQALRSSQERSAPDALKNGYYEDAKIQVEAPEDVVRDVQEQQKRATEEGAASLAVKAPDAAHILQKIEPDDRRVGVEKSATAIENGTEKAVETAHGESDPLMQGAAMAALKKKPSYTGGATETMTYVRNVLGTGGAGVQNLEPSVGAASGAGGVVIAPGVYFIQLASITDQARAAGEWTKMKSRYAVLNGAGFRVQEASLSGGKFYRIQAGPMSKDSATQICDALKKARKPGGCLVVR